MMQLFNKQKLEGKDIDFRVTRRLNDIKNLHSSGKKKDMLIELFQEQGMKIEKLNTNFFKTMEMDLKVEHQAQVNAALEQMLATVNIQKKHEKRLIQQIWKRKEALETMLFKMKYDKLIKTLSGGNYIMSQWSSQK